MRYDDQRLEDLRADPLGQAVILVQEASDDLSAMGQQDGWTQAEYDLLVETVAILAVLKRTGLTCLAGMDVPEVTGSINQDCGNLRQFLSQATAACESAWNKERFSLMQRRIETALRDGFCYEFSAGDMERVQRLINELRDQVRSLEDLEEPHRARVLSRLEKLQAELHKKMSDLDRFWGLVGDAGVVMAKLGNDAKPIVDRIRELTGIVWHTQSRAEELPSDAKLPSLIGHGSNDDQPG